MLQSIRSYAVVTQTDTIATELTHIIKCYFHSTLCYPAQLKGKATQPALCCKNKQLLLFQAFKGFTSTFPMQTVEALLPLFLMVRSRQGQGSPGEY